MTIVLSAAAALLLGTGFVLQQRAAARAPRRDLMRLRLFADLLRQRDWVFGLLAMIGGQVLSGLALAGGRLTLVEPVLTTNLLFALLLAAWLSGQRLSGIELAGAAALTVGVAAFTVTVRWNPGWHVPVPPGAHWPSAGGMALLALVVTGVGRGRRRPWASAAAYAAGAGLCFGIQDALTRRVLGALIEGQVTLVLTDWAVYVLLIVAVTGLLLMQSAFGMAPLRVSLPLVTVLEALGGIALGMVVFGDRLDVRPVAVVVEVASVALIVAGVFVVGRRPLLSSGAGAPPGGEDRC